MVCFFGGTDTFFCINRFTFTRRYLFPPMNAMNAHASHSQQSKFSRIWYFFPLRLLVLHLKKNHFLLLVWLMLFGIAMGGNTSRFGVSQQFLVPEYNGATGCIAFGIVGFAVGGFITGFNLYTYIMHGYRFPFIATLSRPFQKFSLNNFILPALFIATYGTCSAVFQYTREFIPLWKVAINIGSFLAGIVLFQTLSYVYFSYTNKDARAFGSDQRKRSRRKRAAGPVESPIHHSVPWWKKISKAEKWHVETYMSSFHRVNLARDGRHYPRHILERVFSQNHVNAARFEVALILSFLVIGSQREQPFFVIPAAASALLFGTMLLMLVSALHSWTRGWTITLFVGLLLSLNFFYSDLKLITIENRAFGLNYDAPHPSYIPAALAPIQEETEADVQHTLDILNRWRLRLDSESKRDGHKPKLVIVACSGGGSRSAFWTMRSLQFADSLCEGRLLNHTVMMTGASGGMLGAAYLRELMLREQQTGEVYRRDTLRAEDIAEDLLNPIVLSIATNDLFIRYQKVHDGDYSYTKDRAWAFEKQLNENTRGWMDKRLKSYASAEQEALIPMMVLSPTIINDGRRLIIASQPVSYLTRSYATPFDPNPQPEDIEFRRLFAYNDADNLRFLTALRMNSTFPYVLPIVTLPTEPAMEIMDAGLRDNFGIKTTLQYLHTFRNWINTNTSGVVILQVRDLPKGVDLDIHNQSLVSKFLAPLGSIYGNMTKTQNYNNEQLLRYLESSLETEVHLVTLQLEQDIDTHVSLSWHLTKSEKKHIRQAVRDPYFEKEVFRLCGLLK
jgi:hypothetical protein